VIKKRSGMSRRLIMLGTAGGSMVDLVHYDAPDPPPSPDQPQSYSGCPGRE